MVATCTSEPSFAWLGVAATFVIIATYLVLLSWVAGYAGMVVTGSFPSGTTEEVQARFGAFGGSSRHYGF